MEERAQQTAAAGPGGRPVSGETLLTVSTWATTDPAAPGSSLGLAPAGRIKTAPRPRGMKRRRPASLCHRLRLPWPFAARTGASDPSCESESEEEDDVATAAATTLALGGLTLRGPEPLKVAPLGRSTSTTSLGLSRVGSEGSDLSGYVIGADLQPPPQQPQPGGGAGDDNNVVVVQLECPRCQRIDSRVVPAPDDADTGAAATAAAAAAAAAAYAVGAGGGLGHSTSSGAFGPLPPASAAAAVERSGSTGSLSLLLDASGGRSGSGRLSRMPSFRLPSFSLLSGSANGSSNSLSAASGALLPAVLPRGPPVPSASALQLQHLLGVELTAEEHKERELAVAVAAAAAAAAASADAMESLGASVCVSSSSATSSEAASSEDGEASDSSRACTPRVLLLGEEGEKEAKAFVEEEEEEDPHLGLAREVVLELRRGEKTYRPPASFDAATVMVPQPGARQQQQHQQSQQAQPGGGGLPLLMRAVIVDWVLDIHARLKLGPQSLYLAVLILDRFTAQVSLDRPELQLLALASLLVASKHEDVTAPSIKTMLRFTENLPGSGANGSGPPKQQLLYMERRVLEVLGFTFARPTSADFLDLLLGLGDATGSGTKRRSGRGGRVWHPLGADGLVMEGPGQLLSSSSFSSSMSSSGPQAGQGGGERPMPLIHARARYLAERALFDGGLVARFAPSRIAAGAVYLSRRHDTPDAWTPELESWSGYSEAEAAAMGAMLSRLAQEPLPLVGTRRLTALTRKYASSRYREVAAHTVLPLL